MKERKQNSISALFVAGQLNRSIMKSKDQIMEEAKEIFLAIKETMNKMGTDYCQSWWINKNNYKLNSGLSTPSVNQRCRLLVKKGYLIKNDTLTSTHTGTSYKLTGKDFS